MKLIGILNEETFEITPVNQIKGKEQGLPELDYEVAYNGCIYLKGHCPVEPEKTYAEKRLAEYPALGEQFDMMYWDKVNGTNLWQTKINEIKTKYPKV